MSEETRMAEIQPAFRRRRQFLCATAGAAAYLIVPRSSFPAMATSAEVTDLIAELSGDKPVTPGRIKLDIPNMVENGNAVGLTASVDEPLPQGLRVDSFHIFADGNPLPHVANFYFGPRAGTRRVSTRIRLATSQTVTAIARLSDGSCWSDSVELLVTIAACIE
jgi:sulfur-oxidizing protein SoxY